MTEMILFLILCFSFSNSFLLDTTTPSKASSHYNDITDMLAEERKYRTQLETYLGGQLQREIQEMKNETENWKSKSTDIQMENIELQKRIANLEKKTGSKDRLRYLETELNNSRSESETDIRKIKMRIDNAFHSFGVVQASMKANISQIQQGLNQEAVAVQACGGFNHNNKRIIFHGIKNSYGIHNLSDLVNNTGTFHCEKPGYYLVIISLSLTANEARFSIVKNNSTVLSEVQIVPKHNYVRYMIHTGTTSALVRLNVGDTIAVRQSANVRDIYGDSTCLSIVKLK
ncbi:Hypothetical predicted protein [Mytilus galloprovincialis]|uniref:C1q domain-containing protein n=1 Tax=Mytilus galloprovincialis TaxID=29158 RepID=A0A8B6G1A2_MYTGA|nr:Hypothetical predicted protein [Mytilus galloprovincialis]